MKIFFKYFIFILVGLLVFGGLVVGPLYAKEPFLTPHEKAELIKIEEQLREAIKDMNFSDIPADIPIREKFLDWSYCGSKRMDAVYSFDEMVNELKAYSENAEIFINENTDPGLLEVVESRGWEYDFPFIYFKFDFEFDRWYGVEVCDEQQFIEDAKLPPSHKTPEAVRDLKKAIKTGDYEGMRKYVPSGKIYLWGACGPTDMVPNELDFEELNKDLERSGKGRNIKILGSPNLWEWDEKISAGFETGGWEGDYPFITFVFELFQPGSRWAWKSVFDCNHPSERK